MVSQLLPNRQKDVSSNDNQKAVPPAPTDRREDDASGWSHRKVSHVGRHDKGQAVQHDVICCVDVYRSGAVGDASKPLFADILISKVTFRLSSHFLASRRRQRQQPP